MKAIFKFLSSPHILKWLRMAFLLWPYCWEPRWTLPNHELFIFPLNCILLALARLTDSLECYQPQPWSWICIESNEYCKTQIDLRASRCLLLCSTDASIEYIVQTWPECVRECGFQCCVDVNIEDWTEYYNGNSPQLSTTWNHISSIQMVFISVISVFNIYS